MVTHMLEIFEIVAHLFATVVRVAVPGGVRAVIVESLLLKHQLLVLSRSRKRASRLTPWDRLLFGIGAFPVSLKRLPKIAIGRRIVGFGVAPTHVDGVAVCRMFNHARSGQPLPKHVSTDNDPLFRFHRWRANLRVLEIEEIKTVPFVPCSHPFVERSGG
jgi:hypothetical protein